MTGPEQNIIYNWAGRNQSAKSISIFIFCFIIAIFISSFTFIPPLVGLFLIILGLSILLAEKIYHNHISRESFLIFLVLISFSLGSLRYAVKDFHTPVPFFETQIGEKLSFQGVVVSEPEKREENTRFVVSSLEEKIVVSTDIYSPVAYGDKVSISGKLKKPDKIESEDGRTFNYPEYLAKDGIYYTMSFTEVEILSSGHGNFMKRALYGLKHSLVAKMRSILAEPESSLLAGLVVSGKDALPAGILDEFRRAGIVHIVVLSGYNITIIADFLRKLSAQIFLKLRYFGWLGTLAGRGPQVASGFSILGVIGFILMTGAEATVVRAGLMVLAVIAAKLFGRQYSPSRALISAAFLMILQNPKILVFDTSFQLSFLATLALIYVSPIVENYLMRMPNKIGERTMLATTIATQIVVLPYLVYVMGNFSLVSLPANILVLLVIPITMFVGFTASLFGFISSTLAWPFSYVSHLLLSWILGVSHLLGNLKYASMNISKFSFWVVIIIYLTLFVIWKRLRNSVPHSAN